MDVSIIIPVVFDRGWLNECIQSALNQDFKGSYEIILASDGNPEMAEFARKYDLKFTIIEKKNLSANYNNAVRTAKGRYIKMLMDDDSLTKNCLTDLYENIGDYDFIYANAINFTDKNAVVVNAKPATFRTVYERDGIHCGTVMIKRSTFLALGGNDESLYCMEDYDFYLNLLSHGYKMTYVNKIVYKYRMHPGQKSYNYHSPLRIATKKRIREKYKSFYDATRKAF